MLYAVMLCAVASLATGLGGVIVAVFKNFSQRTLALSQGFAAGVMLGVSFMDMLPHSGTYIFSNMSFVRAAVYITVLFSVGWLISMLLARLVTPQQTEENDTVMAVRRLCFVTTAVVVLHNLPEGMLTSFSAFNSKEFGLHIAFAVAMHNIPEGIAVASSVMYVTASRAKAVWQSFMAGIAELVGGVLALAVMYRFVTESFLMAMFVVIAGIMTQVSLCELIPTGAKIYSVKTVLLGLICGVMIIALGMLMI